MTKKKTAPKKPAMTTEYGRGYRAGVAAERKRTKPIIDRMYAEREELDTKARKYKVLMNAADVEVYKLTRACETITADRDAQRLDKEAAMKDRDDLQQATELFQQTINRQAAELVTLRPDWQSQNAAAMTQLATVMAALKRSSQQP
jgi:hypothetical protein